MMRIEHLMLSGLLCIAPGYAAEQNTPSSASALAEIMRLAKYSNGFEARLNVLVTQSNGAHLAPFKLAVVGQLSADKQRLVIRGISPESVRNRFYEGERSGEGRIRALSDTGVEFEPDARLFDSGLVVWDMLSPWWYLSLIHISEPTRPY